MRTFGQVPLHMELKGSIVPMINNAYPGTEEYRENLDRDRKQKGKENQM